MNNEQTDMLSKVFSSGPVAVSRQDYESMPCPMAASLFSDEDMQKLVEDIHADMNVRWTDGEMERLFGDDSSDEADMCQDEFWRAMEIAAVERGMKYYEDMPKS